MMELSPRRTSKQLGAAPRSGRIDCVRRSRRHELHLMLVEEIEAKRGQQVPRRMSSEGVIARPAPHAREVQHPDSKGDRERRAKSEREAVYHLRFSHLPDDVAQIHER